MSVLRDVCCHLFQWVGHHAAHKPKVSDERMAALSLYPSAKRKVRRQPK